MYEGGSTKNNIKHKVLDLNWVDLFLWLFHPHNKESEKVNMIDDSNILQNTRLVPKI